MKGNGPMKLITILPEINRLLTFAERYKAARTKEFRYGFELAVKNYPQRDFNTLFKGAELNYFLAGVATGHEFVEQTVNARKPKMILRKPFKAKYPQKINGVKFEIIRLMGRGYSQQKAIEQAAYKFGITTRAIFKWIKKGRTETQGPYAEFVDNLTKCKTHLSGVRGLNQGLMKRS